MFALADQQRTLTPLRVSQRKGFAFLTKAVVSLLAKGSAKIARLRADPVGPPKPYLYKNEHFILAFLLNLCYAYNINITFRKF